MQLLFKFFKNIFHLFRKKNFGIFFQGMILKLNVGIKEKDRMDDSLYL